MLLRHSICFILHDMLYKLILYLLYILDIHVYFVFQVTQEDLISSLIIAGYCRNMLDPVRRIKEWYIQFMLLVSSNTSDNAWYEH
jgi:hypothetical protein